MAVFRPGATALITGGASGIGFAMAQICRKHAMNLALLDINSDTLSKAAAALPSTAESKTTTHQIDVGDLSAWTALAPTIAAAHPTIDFLMLNAGAGFQPAAGKTTWTDPEYTQKTMHVNLFGVVNGLATFLPVVQKNGSSPAAIVLTGSKQGITNPPGNPAYNASKSAVKTLAEHLAHDLRSASPNISVHLLVPGWAFTGLSGNAGPVPDDVALTHKKPGAWLPSQVAAYAETKMQEGKFYIICPDNDVDEALDQARMTWQSGDWVEGRGALTRWDPKFKDEAAEWIGHEAERRRAK